MRMKMGAGIFLGIILVVIGISIVFKVVFDISFIRVLIGFLVVLLGVKILLGRPFFHNEKDTDNIFQEQTYTSVSGNKPKYNNIFGKVVYDFRNVDFQEKSVTKLEINTIFGDSEVLLPPDQNFKIKADAVFGHAKLPNGKNTSFGDVSYEPFLETGASEPIKIKAGVVFGNLEIKQ